MAVDLDRLQVFRCSLNALGSSSVATLKHCEDKGVSLDLKSVIVVLVFNVSSVRVNPGRGHGKC